MHAALIHRSYFVVWRFHWSFPSQSLERAHSATFEHWTSSSFIGVCILYSSSSFLYTNRSSLSSSYNSKLHTYSGQPILVPFKGIGACSWLALYYDSLPKSDGTRQGRSLKTSAHMQPELLWVRAIGIRVRSLDFMIEDSFSMGIRLYSVPFRLLVSILLLLFPRRFSDLLSSLVGYSHSCFLTAYRPFLLLVCVFIYPSPRYVSRKKSLWITHAI